MSKNPIAKALKNPNLKQRVVVDKKKKDRDKRLTQAEILDALVERGVKDVKE